MTTKTSTQTIERYNGARSTLAATPEAEAAPTLPPCQEVEPGAPRCCTFMDYLTDVPMDAAGKRSGLSYGAMAGIGTAVLTAVGAGAGALIASKSRGKGALIGGAAGAAASAVTVAVFTKKWKDAGGRAGQPGACAAAPAAMSQTSSYGKPLRGSPQGGRCLRARGPCHVARGEADSHTSRSSSVWVLLSSVSAPPRTARCSVTPGRSLFQRPPFSFME